MRDDETLGEIERELRRSCSCEVRFRRLTLNEVPRLELERVLMDGGRTWFGGKVVGSGPETA